MRKRLVLIIFTTLVCLSCAVDQKTANDRAVEKVNSQIKAEKFEEIYERSSDLLKSKISKKEFVEKMLSAAESMKKIESTLNWKRPSDGNEFYRDHSISDTSFRQMNNGVKRTNIYIYWSANFTLCGFETTEIKVVEACS